MARGGPSSVLASPAESATLQMWTPPWAPFDSVEYSNDGAGLLGIALATRGGSTYDDALFRRVLLPLGMSSTMIALGPRTAGHLVTPHNGAGEATAWHASCVLLATSSRPVELTACPTTRASFAGEDKLSDVQ